MIQDIFRDNGFWCQEHLPRVKKEVLMVPRSFWRQTYRIAIVPYIDMAKVPAVTDLLSQSAWPQHCEVTLDRVVITHRCNYHNVDLYIEGQYEFHPKAFDFLK